MVLGAMHSCSPPSPWSLSSDALQPMELACGGLVFWGEVGRVAMEGTQDVDRHLVFNEANLTLSLVMSSTVSDSAAAERIRNRLGR